MFDTLEELDHGLDISCSPSHVDDFPFQKQPIADMLRLRGMLC